MAPWLVWMRMMETNMANSLLRRPGFHRFVGAVHKQFTRMREGIPPEEMGGTNVEKPGQPGFIKLFGDEIKNQFKDLKGGGGASKR